MGKTLNSDKQAGASKSPGEAVTGSGAKAAGKTEYPVMEESFTRLSQSGSKNISKEQALEILQSAVLAATSAGLPVKIYPYKRQVIVVLDNVIINDGNLEVDHA